MTSIDNNGAKSGPDHDNSDARRFIFNKYYPRLLGFAINIIGEKSEAEDIVQDCFMHVFQKKDINEGTPLQQLLFTTVRNLCLNSIKHNAIILKHNAQIQKEQHREALYQADFCGNAMHKMISDELRAKLGEAIETIPERQREAFIMSRIYGMKSKDIAEQMGITTKMVDRHIKNATGLLRKQLKNYLTIGIIATLFC